MKRNIVITSVDSVREYFPEEEKLIMDNGRDSPVVQKLTFDNFKSLLKCNSRGSEEFERILFCYEHGESNILAQFDRNNSPFYVVEINVRSPFLAYTSP